MEYNEKIISKVYIKKYILAPLISCIILTVLNFFWFIGLMEQGTIMGDDIRIYHYIMDSNNVIKTIFTNGMGNFRPVFYSFFAMFVYLFGTNYDLYFIANLCLNCVIVYSIYFITYKLTKGNNFSSFIACIIYTVSIYSYYGITQLFGFMELLCILWVVWFFYFIFLYCCYRNSRYFLYSVLFYLLALLTHERFLALLGVYLVMNFIVFYKDRFSKKVIMFLVASLPAILFVLLKVVVFRSKLLVGTGNIEMGFNIGRTLIYIGQTILSMFGFNLGADYLFGYTFDKYSLLEKIGAFLVLISIFILVVWFLYKNIVMKFKSNAGRTELSVLVTFIFTEGACIICYCLSARIEMRQLYVPMTLLIIYLTYCWNRLEANNRLIKGVTVFCLVIVVTVSFKFRVSIDQLFFMRAQKLARETYDNIIPFLEENVNCKVYVQNDGELIWADMIGEKNIFDMYLEKPVETVIFDDYENIFAQIEEDLNEDIVALVMVPRKDRVGVKSSMISSQSDLNSFRQELNY